MAREAKIIYTAEDRTKAAAESVKRGMGQVGEMARLAGFSLAALGGAGTIAGMVAMLKRINDNVDALNDLSDATGSSIENISALEDVASRNGHAFESVSTTLVRFNQVLSDTRKPGSDAEKVLKALGLNAQRLRELDPAQALHETAVAFGRFADDGNKARAMQELFGKSTKDVAAFVKDLAEQQELNATLTTKQTDEAEKFNKQLFAMQTELRDVGREIARSVVPEMANMLKHMREIRELGGLWAFIGSGAESASMDNPFGKITELEGKLAKLLSDRQKIAGSAANNGPLRYLPLFGTVGDLHTLDEQIKQVEKQLDFFRRLDGRRLQEAGAGALQDEMNWYAPRGSVNVPDGPDKKAIAAAQKAADQYAALIGKIKERLQLGDQELAFGRKLTDAEKFEIQTLEQLANSKLKLTPAQEAVIRQGLEEVKTREAQIETQQALTKATADAAKVRQEYIDGLNGDLAKLQKELDQQRDHNAAIGLGKEAIAALEAARLEDQATILQGQAIKKLDRDLDYQAYDLTMQQVEALRELSRLKREGAARESQFEIATRHQKEQIDLLKQTDEIARDVFVSIATEGGDAFKAIGRSIKANVINMLYQMTLRPFVIQLAGSLIWAPGSAIGQAIGGANALGAVSGITGMIPGLGGGLAGLSSSFAGGAFNAALGVGVPVAPGIGMATGGFGGAMASIAPAMPYIGAALAIASLLSGSFKGETRVGGVYHNTDFQVGPSGGQIPGATDAIGATIASINSMLGAFGSDQQIMRLVSGLEQSERGKGFAFAGGFLSGGGTFGQGTDGYGWQNRRGSMTAEEALAAFGEELQQATLQALAAADLPGEIGDYLRELGDIDALAGEDLKAAVEFVNTYATNVQSFRALVEAMPVARLRDVSMEVANSLVTLSGGFEAFAANFSTYVENFYSDEEKRAQTIRNITSTLTTAGFSVTEADIASATREQFRAWVEGVDLSTDAGRRAYTALLGVSGAFATLTEVAADLGTTVEDTADIANELLETTRGDLLDAYGDLESILNGVIDKNNAYAQSLRQVRLNLTSGPGALLSPEARYNMAAAEFRRLSALPVGDEERLEKLAEAGAAFAEASQAYNASSMQYFADRDEIVRAVESSEIYAKANVDVAQLQLNTARSQLIELGLIKAQATTQTQVMQTFAAAMQAYLAAQTTAAGGGVVTNPVPGDPDSVSVPALGGMIIHRNRIKKSKSGGSYIGPMDPILPMLTPEASAAIWGFSLNGSHASGLDYVPFDGYRAELHRGERVQTAAQARAADQTAALMQQLLDENRALNQRIDGLTNVFASYARRDLAIGESLAESMQGAKNLALLEVARARPKVGRYDR